MAQQNAIAWTLEATVDESMSEKEKKTQAATQAREVLAHILQLSFYIFNLKEKNNTARCINPVKR